MTINEFKQSAYKKLPNSPSPQLDVTVLMEHILGFSKTDLLLHNNDELSSEKESWLNNAIEKRNTGLPVAYITGHKEFYGYDFFVTSAVLIPKPDTEILVERAIEVIIEKMDARPNTVLSVCDMCTGSGCIALAVLRTLIDEYKIPSGRLPKFTLVDISPAALEIAQKNAAQLCGAHNSNIRFTRSNLFEQVPWSFDVILTNPPYIPHTMVDELLQDGRNEPRLALDGDVIAASDGIHTPGDSTGKNDGLGIIRDLIPQAQNHLNPHGTILMETGEYNAQDTAFIAGKWGFKTNVIQDLEGQDRVVEMN